MNTNIVPATSGQRAVDVWVSHATGRIEVSHRVTAIVAWEIAYSSRTEALQAKPIVHDQRGVLGVLSGTDSVQANGCDFPSIPQFVQHVIELHRIDSTTGPQWFIST
ncbi:hypothetical protein [Cupriavidus pauculus]|uniref:Uncharacterized protein n=1 Tax=Cupriavidus pauculus TaxID=82633 RepID=A0A2N5C971_9BURK|nr:hypothetical protein [Cupriavidus pauculus]PLP98744.1 hypothetical protein CYJ10_20840 [Cupriavidus pauculus]